MKRIKKALRWSLAVGSIMLLACGGTDHTGGGGSGGDGGGTPPTCLGGCSRGFLCQGTTCTLDPTGSWVLRVTSGTVAARQANGATWDGDGSPPDPLVCLTLNNVRSCTRTIQDTYAPVWNSDFPAATATALQAGVPSEYTDEDSLVNDPICAGSIPVTLDEFKSGIWGFRCTSGIGQVDATLTAR